MNIARLTEEYIAGHPAIKDCIKKDLINYSALARQICEGYKLDQFDAVLIACRRYFWKIKKQETHETEIISLLKAAKIRVRNRMIVAIADKPRDPETLQLLQKRIKKKKGDLNLIEGEYSMTIVTNSEFLPVINELLKGRLVKVNENLIQITLLFDEKIETTSGVVSYIYSLLADNGINVLEEMSCWTDLMLILDEKDLAIAMKVLSF